jgi:drug/metabolite transporter (DMT)-like permease
MSSQDSRHGVKVASALATIYIIWGSSFLFSKIAVKHLPPLLFSAVRFIAAGIVLATFARLIRRDAWPRRPVEWRHVAITGFLMVVGSNAVNLWAIQYIPSNLSALLNGTSAFWIAGLGVFGRRGHPLTRPALIGMCVGFAGTVLMLVPKGGLRTSSLLAEAGALTACLSWALGTLYFRSIDTELSALMFMALQMLTGGAMVLVLAVANGDPARWAIDVPGLVSLGYLTLFSSCLAYTAYGWLSLNVPPPLVGTYGYVNPAIATYLGWQFLDEHLSGVQLAGMIIIIGAVCLLTLPGGAFTDSKTLAEPKSQ